MDNAGINASDRIAENPLKKSLALAFAVVKSKTANTSLHEYLSGLSQRSEAGRRDKDTGPSYRHVDGAAFWRKAYDKAEIAQTGLRARIHELERTNEALSSKLNLPEASTTKSSTEGKRKRGKEPADTANAELAKRPKGQCHDEGPLPNPLLAELSVPSSNESSYMLLLYKLHSQLPQRRYDASELSSNLVKLASAAFDVARTTCERYRDQVSLNSPNGSPPTCSSQVHGTSTTLRLDPETTSTFRALERTFYDLLRGLDKLTKDLFGKRSQGFVIYHFVKLLSNLLELLHTTSLFLAEQQMAVEKVSLSTRPRKGKKQLKKPSTPSFGLLESEDDVRPHLSRLLSAMIVELQPTQAAHCELLEGFLYVLLERIGHVLHGFVFKEPDGIDLNINTRASRSRALRENPAHEAEQRAKRAETYYLIWILERALASFPQDSPGDFAHAWDPSKGLRNSIEHIKSTSGAPMRKELLSETARTRLQKTLLRGMFGDDLRRFQDCLQKPTISEIAPEMPTVARQSYDTEDWFKSQIWRLIGWEILSKDVDLGEPLLG